MAKWLLTISATFTQVAEMSWRNYAERDRVVSWAGLYQPNFNKVSGRIRAQNAELANSYLFFQSHAASNFDFANVPTRDGHKAGSGVRLHFSDPDSDLKVQKKPDPD